MLFLIDNYFSQFKLNIFRGNKNCKMAPVNNKRDLFVNSSLKT